MAAPAIAALLVMLPSPAEATPVRPAAALGHPFPAHVTYQVGVVPSASQSSKDAAVEAAYNTWKGKFLTTGCGAGQYRVVSPDVSPNATVSEGQGYGMNIVPLMAGFDGNAQTEFNGLWSLVQAHEDQYGLMQWNLDGSNHCQYGGGIGTPDSATDGDLDIGYGLILADKQWGGFTSAALTWLGRIYAHDVDPSGGFLDLADDTPGSGDSYGTRPSDFMLDHLRVFAAYDTSHNWNGVITKLQSVTIQFSGTYSPNTGLLSDFVIHANTSNPQPAPANYLESKYDGISSYNSLRVPWHMGTDALEFASSVSLKEAQLLSASFKRAAGGSAGKIYPTNQLNGTPTDLSGGQCICATASVGPSAMAAGDQGWTDAIWSFMTSNANPYGDSYYGYTIRLLNEIVMASDYWNPVGSAGGGIVNGGFETGDFTGWTRAGTTSITGSGPHSGTYAAQLGTNSPTNGDSQVAQTFVAPAGSSQLSFFYNITCPDVVQWDWATATLKDNTSGLSTTPLAKSCTLGQGWQTITATVTAGHTYTLTLVSHDENNPGDPTFTRYDDVSLG
jgi:endo-1,4-beta-D-glucanase Y